MYLVRGKEILMMSEDHIPTFEKERDRIEAFNPNPLMPMVRKVGDTWRVGGLLARCARSERDPSLCSCCGAPLLIFCLRCCTGLAGCRRC